MDPTLPLGMPVDPDVWDIKAVSVMPFTLVGLEPNESTFIYFQLIFQQNETKRYTLKNSYTKYESISSTSNKSFTKIDSSICPSNVKNFA